MKFAVYVRALVHIADALRSFICILAIVIGAFANMFWVLLSPAMDAQHSDEEDYASNNGLEFEDDDYDDDNDYTTEEDDDPRRGWRRPWRRRRGTFRRVHVFHVPLLCTRDAP